MNHQAHQQEKMNVLSNSSLFDMLGDLEPTPIADAGVWEPIPLEHHCPEQVVDEDFAGIFDAVADVLQSSAVDVQANNLPNNVQQEIIPEKIQPTWSLSYSSHPQKYAKRKNNNASNLLSLWTNKLNKNQDSTVATTTTNTMNINMTLNLQSGRWQERFQDLGKFQQEHTHCCVPSHWKQNPPLAQWVRRQRYQMKLKKEGQHSTMTDDRKVALDQMGFVWDPHSAFWEERLDELDSFREKHGHCNIPTKYPANPQLAIWAKCQRRQFKLYCNHGSKRSNMTLDRITKLAQVDFVFSPREVKKQTLAKVTQTLAFFY